MQLAALHFVSLLAQFHRACPKEKFNLRCRCLRLFNNENKVLKEFKLEVIQTPCWLCDTESVWLTGRGTEAERHRRGGEGTGYSSFTLEGEEKGERLNATIAFCPPEVVKLCLLDDSKLCLSLRFYDFAEQGGTKRKKTNQTSVLHCPFF